MCYKLKYIFGANFFPELCSLLLGGGEEGFSHEVYLGQNTQEWTKLNL